MNFGDTEYPWPRLGDDLFSDEGKDWWNIACVNWALGDQRGSYATAFKEAGDILVERVNESGYHQDYLVYPIMFNYRQYLELQLKRLIVLGSALLDHEVDPTLINSHFIDRLWTRCRAILEEHAPQGSGGEYDAVEAVVHSFAAVDPASYAFRYPTDKSGRALLPATLKQVNLRNVGEVIGRIAGFLDAAEDDLSMNLDFKLEMEREYGP